MGTQDDVSLDEVTFDELERVDEYEATFTGTLDGEEITLTYTLESGIGTDEEATVFVPGDEELEDVIVQPETYEFETDERDEVRFEATGDDDQTLFLVYAFSEAADSDENEVGLDVSP